MLRTILLGVGATLAMDAWAWLLRRLGMTTLNFAFLGRLIGHLRQERFMHQSIADANPVKGELLIGWCAHYSIGMAFAALQLGTFGLKWARSPTLPAALFMGIVTVAAPWLVLQPALGAGIASSRTSRPAFNSVKSVATHAVYGLGLYLAALATAAVVPAAE